MWVNVIAAGSLGLLGVGVWRLWRGRATTTDDRGGSNLLRRGASVQFGLPVTAGTTTGDADTVAELADALAERVGERTADEFTAVHEAMEGEGAVGPDVVTVALVAAARTAVDVGAVESWATSTGVASPETVASRRDELGKAGILAEDCFVMERKGLEEADPDDVAAVTASLLD
ncbi:hypothetical protein [Haloarchaeobius sp. HRN-SO-5]|uniref:hypothetical protein n=1 Tax=Haloarchaeobius sp. HRN-SO-5 TaxID=3446118 RepID=UPI003EBA1185